MEFGGNRQIPEQTDGAKDNHRDGRPVYDRVGEILVTLLVALQPVVDSGHVSQFTWFV